MEYPSTPKQFNLFQEYKNVEHDGNMLTADQRTRVYEDRSKVVAEMAKAFYIFSRSIFFNLEMAEQYNLSRDKYINYFSQIVQNIDIFLQEDQLMCTKAGFSLVPVPGYLPNSNDLEQKNADQITQTVRDEVNTISREMQVIMQGDNKHPHINKSGSFSHLRSFELNDMGFSLNKINPITFDMENPQTPADHGIKSRAQHLHHEKDKLHKLIMKQQTTTRPTMNLVVALHTTQMNPLQTNMSKEDSSHLKQTTWLHSHSKSHCPRKAAKRTPPSMDHDTTEKGVPRAVLQGQQMVGHKDQLLQHPQHRLEDHHRLPQSPIQAETTRIHWNAMTPMDPPKHLQMAKAKELLNQRRHQNLILGLQQIWVLLLSLLTHQRTLLYVLGVVKVATGAEIVHTIISVIFVE